MSTPNSSAGYTADHQSDMHDGLTHKIQPLRPPGRPASNVANYVRHTPHHTAPNKPHQAVFDKLARNLMVKSQSDAPTSVHHLKQKEYANTKEKRSGSKDN